MLSGYNGRSVVEFIMDADADGEFSIDDRTGSIDRSVTVISIRSFDALVIGDDSLPTSDTVKALF